MKIGDRVRDKHGSRVGTIVQQMGDDLYGASFLVEWDPLPHRTWIMAGGLELEEAAE